MAGAAVMEVIGVVSGLLGIVQFGIDNFAPPDDVGSTVRVMVGLDIKGELNNAGGDFPDLRLYNEQGDCLGKKFDQGKTKTGSAMDMMVKYSGDAGQQATYTLFTANNDAICIAYASITWPTGDKYGWWGDWGRECGGAWYVSNVYVGEGNISPPCLWIDGDGNQPNTGFQTDHDPKVIVVAEPKHMRSLEGRDAAAPAGLKTVYGPPKYPHPTSWGPDFLHVHSRLFCRMSDKTVCPICDQTTKDNCFNKDLNQLVINGRATRDQPYKQVVDWTAE
ncbi:hypothetical protein F5Y17DRAFT_466626 [Xylariaceae sp. FL0594]|nr:hypothetical protein F5Y17DRAFT_466626 [Xylariaceae sp. FL0594]